MKHFLFVVIVLFSASKLKANDPGDGYAVVKTDTIYGKIKINFDAGSVIVKQDGVNRMFLSDIESVTMLNESRDTYYTYSIDGKTKFYKALVVGSKPLIEDEGVLYCVLDDYPTVIEEKTLQSLFGKKELKEYVFVRNLSLNNEEDLVDIFRYFNSYL